MFIELKKKTYNELIDLLKSLEKFELIKSLENGADDDYVPPVVNKKEIYSEDEGSAEEESLSGVTIDKNGFWSLK
jgi:hypothetical protein